MKNLFAEQLKRIKDFFSPEKEKEVIKSAEETLSKYQEEKTVIKSLFDNDVIDFDEYIEKIKIIEDMIGEVKKKKIEKYDYADAIIRNECGYILFLRRNSNDEFWPDCWALPGGKIEEGETAQQAVIRET